MEFITDNYIIIIIIGLFFMFALVGYLIDMLRNNNNNNNEQNKIEIPSEISPVSVANIEQTNEKDKDNNKKDDSDELLENYDKEN